MALLQKVMSIIAHVLLSITVLLGITCLTWTLVSTAVREGLETGLSTAQDAINSMVEGAQGTLGFDIDAVTNGLTSGITQDDVQGMLALGSGGTTTAESFADSALGAAYQAWKDDVSSPVERVFVGTSIDEELLVGVAGGSVSASQVLESLDDATLTRIYDNAGTLALTANSHIVSSALPQGVQDEMRAADRHCVSFCAQAQQLVEAVRGYRQGNPLALASAASAADAATSELRAMETCMLNAEATLGA